VAVNFIRYNATSKIYELSTDDGSNFAALPLDAAILTQGIIGSIARIATGTPDGTKFVRDDRTLQALAAGDILSGALDKARQHAQTAYKDEANVFSLAGNSFLEILGVAKGLQFPATQVASSDANVLDDYEEGTWTPVIGGATSESGQTYTQQIGNYVKFGKQVFITCDVALSAKGTITGDVVIKGLPFSGAAFNQPSIFSRWLNTVTSFVELVFNTDGAIAEIYVITAATTSVGTAMVTGDIGDSTRFIFVASYIATG